MDNECNDCCCAKCHDYTCSIWRCGLECKETKDPIKECEWFTLQNPDYRDGDGEDCL